MILDKALLESLYYEYGPRLVSYAGRYLADAATAQDVVQDAFIHFWEKYHGKDNNCWQFILLTMTRNKCLDNLRHYCFLRTVINPDIEVSSEEELLYCEELSCGKATDSYLLYEELSNEIDDALSRLSPKAREVFEKSRKSGMKNSDIALSLGISEKAVEKSITRALKFLKKYFSRR